VNQDAGTRVRKKVGAARSASSIEELSIPMPFWGYLTYDLEALATEQDMRKQFQNGKKPRN
jgi:hypothetical protein